MLTTVYLNQLFYIKVSENSTDSSYPDSLLSSRSHFSFESTISNASPQAVASAEEPTLALHSRRLKIISRITLSAFIFLIFLSFICPWYITRDNVINSTHFFAREYLNSSNQYYYLTLNHLFESYERVAVMLGEMGDYPPLINCNKDSVYQLIKYSESINLNINPKPYRFYSSKTGVAACQLEYNLSNLSNFQLYYFNMYNETFDQIRIYDQDTDFQHWDPDNSGQFEKFVPAEDSIFRNVSTHFSRKINWNSHIAVFGGQNETRAITCIYTISNPEGTNSSFSGVTILNEDIYNNLTQIQKGQDTFWVLLDPSLKIIIDSEEGALFPDKINSEYPQFPLLNTSKHTLWKIVYENFDSIQGDEPVFFDFSNLDNLDHDQYFYVMKRNITTSGGISFYFLSAIEVQKSVENWIRNITHPFIFFILTSILLFIAHGMAWNSIQKKKTKRLRSSMINERPRSNHIGVLGKIIRNLRQLELAHPEEVMMNDVVDLAVKELSKTNENVFGMSSSCNCEFCRHFFHEKSFRKEEKARHQHNAKFNFHNNYFINNNANNNSTTDQKSTKLYESWKFLSFLKINPPKEFEYDFLQFSAPKYNFTKQLIKLFSAIIEMNEIYRIEFDPDNILKFVFSLSRKYIKKLRFKTIISLYQLNMLISDIFPRWIPSSLDLFLLFFSSLVRNIDFNDFLQEINQTNLSFIRTNDLLTEKEFPDQKNKQLNHIYQPNNENNNLNENKSKSCENDEDSKNNFQEIFFREEKEINFILTLFFRLVSVNLNETTRYFIDNFSLIYQKIQKGNELQLFGEFCNRLENPDFSVNNNQADKILFISALLIISDYALFSELKYDEAIPIMNEIKLTTFSDHELKNNKFVFHYYSVVCEKILLPWLEAMNSIGQMERYIENVNEMISCLHISANQF
ncbi:hypothetical protein TRFO_29831 [Tritrichomonas foetus]|uniref:Uncharacterized protein n=1 Tax=Tritrichomonas foetus TaxID=1144522 RepID=A0A1J4JWW8_9EUKA|nr:hypothetical protein TRFO_29831 [Tritrichomonas foetus]|eukprot:OHT02952.1 hypothetical protein TRFO_29831 [Tritrichomonas foetus]